MLLFFGNIFGGKKSFLKLKAKSESQKFGTKCLILNCKNIFSDVNSFSLVSRPVSIETVSGDVYRGRLESFDVVTMNCSLSNVLRTSPKDPVHQTMERACLRSLLTIIINVNLPPKNWLILNSRGNLIHFVLLPESLTKDHPFFEELAKMKAAAAAAASFSTGRRFGELGRCRK